MVRSIVASLALVLVLVLPCQAQDGQAWDPPKDGLVTAKQLDLWIELTLKLFDVRDRLVKELGEIDQKKKGGVAETAACSKRFDDEVKKVRAGSGLKEAEAEWVGKQATDIHVTLGLQRQMSADFDRRDKENKDQLEVSKKRLDELEKAKKAGRRYLTPEQRTDAEKAAAEQVAEAEKNLKEASEKVAAAKAALATEEKELAGAKDDDAKAAAEGAVAGAKDALEQARTAETEAKQNVERAKKKAKDVDLPETPEEKEAVVRDLNEQIEATKVDHENSKKQLDAYAGFRKQTEANMAEQLNKYPEKNRALVNERAVKLKAILGRAFGATPDEAKDEKK